jgi:hypothetical protein
MKITCLAGRAVLLLFILAISAGSIESRAQESQAEPAETKTGQMSLRKTVGVRIYKGREVEGENRLIAPGDSLWRILIQERGLPEKRFSQYVVVIRGLNPQIKRPNFLRVGDNVFIPLRPDEVVASGVAPQELPGKAVAIARGATKGYRVKRGDHLYQILRDQLGIYDEKELAVYYALTKDLNPNKKEWNILQEGEVIRLPTTAEVSEVASASSQRQAARRDAEVKSSEKEVKPKQAKAAEKAQDRVVQKEQRAGTGSKGSSMARQPKESEAKKEAVPKAPATFPRDHEAPLAKQNGDSERSPSVADVEPAEPASPKEFTNPPLDYARQLSAKDNMSLINRIAHALGGETESNGEETFKLPDGTVRLDRSAYPVIYSPKLRQRVVMDPQNNIPPSLKKKLDDPRVAAPVLALSQESSLQEAVDQLLSRLGYQPLPEDRPVVIQEKGVAYEARGSWMALAPQESNKTQEILVITLTNHNGEIPEYLKSELARKGLHLEDVVLPSRASGTGASVNSDGQKFLRQTKRWPRDKKDLVDALLLAHGIPFGVLETVSVHLHDGLRVDRRVDRLFNLRGKRTALFFEHVEPEIKSALEEKEGTRVIELDLSSLAPRALIAKMLTELGEKVSYQQHRFAVGNGNPERLNISAWGFLVTRHSMFITDREIPKPIQRFFFEKGLDIVYFQ